MINTDVRTLILSDIFNFEHEKNGGDQRCLMIGYGFKKISEI